jgi:hypothetical protein
VTVITDIIPAVFLRKYRREDAGRQGIGRFGVLAVLDSTQASANADFVVRRARPESRIRGARSIASIEIKSRAAVG